MPIDRIRLPRLRDRIMSPEAAAARIQQGLLRWYPPQQKMASSTSNGCQSDSSSEMPHAVNPPANAP